MKSLDVVSRPKAIAKRPATWPHKAAMGAFWSPLITFQLHAAAKFCFIERGDGVLEPLLIIIIVSFNKNLTLTGAAKIKAAISGDPGFPQRTWLRNFPNFFKGKFLKIQRINHKILFYHIYLER